MFFFGGGEIDIKKQTNEKKKHVRHIRHHHFILYTLYLQFTRCLSW